jgi:hypothetical protein
MNRFLSLHLTTVLAGLTAVVYVLLCAGCGANQSANEEISVRDTLSVVHSDSLIDFLDRFPLSVPTSPPVSNKKLGKVAYNTPDDLIIGRPAIIEAQIGFEDVMIPEGEFIGQGLISTQTIELTDRVRLSLICTNDPDVHIEKAFDDPEQTISDGKLSKWTWRVTAASEGEKEFLLSVAIGTRDSHGEAGFSVHERTQFIISTQALSWEEKAMAFVMEHWPWFASSIGIPLVVFFFKRSGKIRNEDAGNG